MNATDLEQIGTLIEEKLEPIKDILDEHTRKLDGIVDQLADVSVDVSEIKDKVSSHEKRISKVEDHLGLPAAE